MVFLLVTLSIHEGSRLLVVFLFCFVVVFFFIVWQRIVGHNWGGLNILKVDFVKCRAWTKVCQVLLESAHICYKKR